MKGSEDMDKMPSAVEIAVEIARENERLKMQIEQLKQRITELEKQLGK